MSSQSTIPDDKDSVFVVMRADGKVEVHLNKIKNRNVGLKILQKHVGGYIETVPGDYIYLDDFFESSFIKKTTWICVVNEEGLCIGMPQNNFFPKIYGDLVICQGNKSGAIKSFPFEDFKALPIYSISKDSIQYFS